jgi:hypothetical protein
LVIIDGEGVDCVLVKKADLAACEKERDHADLAGEPCRICGLPESHEQHGKAHKYEPNPAPPEAPRRCVWHFHANDDYWETSCGEAYCFFEGGVKENKTKFCQYCGRPVVEDTGSARVV